MYGYSKKNSVTNKIIVMKTRYFLFVFLLCFFFSCAEEDNMVISNEMLTESSLQMEQAKIAIYAMGLDTTFISEWDRYYVVEEDILVVLVQRKGDYILWTFKNRIKNSTGMFFVDFSFFNLIIVFNFNHS